MQLEGGRLDRAMVCVFDEGWARYAERLPDEVGLLAPPELLIGETVRAGTRNFLVDVGVNARG
jgi:uncharacterized protein (DUF885 family)